MPHAVMQKHDTIRRPFISRSGFWCSLSMQVPASIYTSNLMRTGLAAKNTAHCLKKIISHGILKYLLEEKAKKQDRTAQSRSLKARCFGISRLCATWKTFSRARMRYVMSVKGSSSHPGALIYCVWDTSQQGKLYLYA